MANEKSDNINSEGFVTPKSTSSGVTVSGQSTKHLRNKGTLTPKKITNLEYRENSRQQPYSRRSNIHQEKESNSQSDSENIHNCHYNEITEYSPAEITEAYTPPTRDKNALKRSKEVPKRIQIYDEKEEEDSSTKYRTRKKDESNEDNIFPNSYISSKIKHADESNEDRLNKGLNSTQFSTMPDSQINNRNSRMIIVGGSLPPSTLNVGLICNDKKEEDLDEDDLEESNVYQHHVELQMMEKMLNERFPKSKVAIGLDNYGGLGLFATETISAGELVLSDQPVISCSTDLKEMFHRLMTLKLEQLSAFVGIPTHEDELSLEEAAEIMSVVPEEKDPETLKVFRWFVCLMKCNAHGLPHDNTNNRGLYPIGVRANHSCCPNLWYRNVNSGELQYVAVRDVAKGEQLNISYINHLFASRDYRQHFLSKEKMFVCQCVKCQRDSIRADPSRLIECPICRYATQNNNDIKTDHSDIFALHPFTFDNPNNNMITNQSSPVDLYSPRRSNQSQSLLFSQSSHYYPETPANCANSNPLNKNNSDNRIGPPFDSSMDYRWSTPDNSPNDDDDDDDDDDEDDEDSLLSVESDDDDIHSKLPSSSPSCFSQNVYYPDGPFSLFDHSLTTISEKSFEDDVDDDDLPTAEFQSCHDTPHSHHSPFSSPFHRTRSPVSQLDFLNTHPCGNVITSSLSHPVYPTQPSGLASSYTSYAFQSSSSNDEHPRPESGQVKTDDEINSDPQSPIEIFNSDSQSSTLVNQNTHYHFDSYGNRFSRPRLSDDQPDSSDLNASPFSIPASNRPYPHIGYSILVPLDDGRWVCPQCNYFLSESEPPLASECLLQSNYSQLESNFLHPDDQSWFRKLYYLRTTVQFTLGRFHWLNAGCDYLLSRFFFNAWHHCFSSSIRDQAIESAFRFFNYVQLYSPESLNTDVVPWSSALMRLALSSDDLLSFVRLASKFLRQLRTLHGPTDPYVVLFESICYYLSTFNIPLFHESSAAIDIDFSDDNQILMQHGSQTTTSIRGIKKRIQLIIQSSNLIETNFLMKPGMEGAEEPAALPRPSMHAVHGNQISMQDDSMKTHNYEEIINHRNDPSLSVSPNLPIVTNRSDTQYTPDFRLFEGERSANGDTENSDNSGIAGKSNGSSDSTPRQCGSYQQSDAVVVPQLTTSANENPPTVQESPNSKLRSTSANSSLERRTSIGKLKLPKPSPTPNTDPDKGESNEKHNLLHSEETDEPIKKAISPLHVRSQLTKTKLSVVNEIKSVSVSQRFAFSPPTPSRLPTEDADNIQKYEDRRMHTVSPSASGSRRLCRLSPATPCIDFSGLSLINSSHQRHQRLVNFPHTQICQLYTNILGGRSKTFSDMSENAILISDDVDIDKSRLHLALISPKHVSLTTLRHRAIQSLRLIPSLGLPSMDPSTVNYRLPRHQQFQRSTTEVAIQTSPRCPEVSPFPMMGRASRMETESLATALTPRKRTTIIMEPQSIAISENKCEESILPTVTKKTVSSQREKTKEKNSKIKSQQSSNVVDETLSSEIVPKLTTPKEHRPMNKTGDSNAKPASSRKLKSKPSTGTVKSGSSTSTGTLKEKSCDATAKSGAETSTGTLKEKSSDVTVKPGPSTSTGTLKEKSSDVTFKLTVKLGASTSTGTLREKSSDATVKSGASTSPGTAKEKSPDATVKSGASTSPRIAKEKSSDATVKSGASTSSRTPKEKSPDATVKSGATGTLKKKSSDATVKSGATGVLKKKSSDPTVKSGASTSGRTLKEKSSDVTLNSATPTSTGTLKENCSDVTVKLGASTSTRTVKENCSDVTVKSDASTSAGTLKENFSDVTVKSNASSVKSRKSREPAIKSNGASSSQSVGTTTNERGNKDKDKRNSFQICHVAVVENDAETKKIRGTVSRQRPQIREVKSTGDSGYMDEMASNQTSPRKNSQPPKSPKPVNSKNDVENPVGQDSNRNKRKRSVSLINDVQKDDKEYNDFTFDEDKLTVVESNSRKAQRQHTVPQVEKPEAAISQKGQINTRGVSTIEGSNHNINEVQCRATTTIPVIGNQGNPISRLKQLAPFARESPRYPVSISDSPTRYVYTEPSYDEPVSFGFDLSGTRIKRQHTSQSLIVPQQGHFGINYSNDPIARGRGVSCHFVPEPADYYDGFFVKDNSFFDGATYRSVHSAFPYSSSQSPTRLTHIPQGPEFDISSPFSARWSHQTPPLSNPSTARSKISSICPTVIDTSRSNSSITGSISPFNTGFAFNDGRRHFSLNRSSNPACIRVHHAVPRRQITSSSQPGRSGTHDRSRDRRPIFHSSPALNLSTPASLLPSTRPNTSRQQTTIAPPLWATGLSPTTPRTKQNSLLLKLSPVTRGSIYSHSSPKGLVNYTSVRNSQLQNRPLLKEVIKPSMVWRGPIQL